MQTTKPILQFRLRTLLILTTVVAVLLGGFILWRLATYQMFHAILVGETGLIETRKQWPDPLKQLPDNPQLQKSAIVCSTISIRNP